MKHLFKVAKGCGMKRTYEQSISFFANRKTTNRGNNRELYNTPYNIIFSIISNLLIVYPFLTNKKWIDPCAGDGRWAEVIKEFGIECDSYDIEPLNNKVKKQDFFTSTTYKDCFYIGNPPFTMVKQFVDKSLETADLCYFLGGSMLLTGSLSDRVKLLHRFEGFEGNQKDKRSKVLFEDTNNEKVIVWCCGALFTNELQNKFQRKEYLVDKSFAVSPKQFCIEDTRVKKI